MRIPALIHVAVVAVSLVSGCRSSSESASLAARPFQKLPEAASDEAKLFAVAFDFDTDSCYPSPAISTRGELNPGLPSGVVYVRPCRERSQLTNSNTYHREVSIRRRGRTYTVHMYALYFMVDRNWAGGHRHDWEYALVWLTDGRLTHGSRSAHGGLKTLPVAELEFDPGRRNTLKIVYHKNWGRTHAFRFAHSDERGDENAENHLRRWVTPTLVDWFEMKSDDVSNRQLRRKLNNHDFGSANCSVNNHNFPNNIAKNPPAGYPSPLEWREAIERQ